jgi:hypothetical protein
MNRMPECTRMDRDVRHTCEPNKVAQREPVVVTAAAILPDSTVPSLIASASRTVSTIGPPRLPVRNWYLKHNCPNTPSCLQSNTLQLSAPTFYLLSPAGRNDCLLEKPPRDKVAPGGDNPVDIRFIPGSFRDT